ncbi:hypothetical protein V6N11_048761 [Hibiscus sabdariffa]|uniref:Uncharacterized protein n=1 Tax=Hibiscus sabdariffa TaxID=183260 RepID=A0ABR2PWN8_9ROSI
MSEAPKLYDHKPKKTQLKQFQQQQKGKEFASTSSGAAASYTMAQPSPPPPPQPPRESFARRYKFLWPLLLAVNFTVGAYLFTRTKKKDTSITEEGVDSSPPISTATVAAPPVTETPLPSAPPMTQNLKVYEPIPESQQRELFKYILEEKRKIKPKDPEEKKRIDEEKAILKQFIRAKAIPHPFPQTLVRHIIFTGKTVLNQREEVRFLSCTHSICSK